MKKNHKWSMKNFNLQIFSSIVHKNNLFLDMNVQHLSKKQPRTYFSSNLHKILDKSVARIKVLWSKNDPQCCIIPKTGCMSPVSMPNFIEIGFFQVFLFLDYFQSTSIIKVSSSDSLVTGLAYPLWLHWHKNWNQNG